MNSLSIGQICQSLVPPPHLANAVIRAVRALPNGLNGVLDANAFLRLLQRALDEARAIDVLPLVLAAWSKVERVRAVLQDGSSAEVELAEHTISIEEQPSIQLELEGVPVHEVKIGLSLELTFSGVILSIAGGQIQEVRLAKLLAEVVVELFGETHRQELAEVLLPTVSRHPPAPPKAQYAES